MSDRTTQLRKLKEAIQHLYAVVGELREAFGESAFTPDGRMIGDIGEAIAALRFGVQLDGKNRKHWDGWWEDSQGKRHEVQVRTTQKDGTYMKKPLGEGTLLVFQITPDGGYKVIYNGDIMRVWNEVKKQKSKEKSINLSTLEGLNLENDPLRVSSK